MALIQTGVIVGNISGSLGSTTFSHNRSGKYIRNRTIPVNPNSARQVVVRSTLSALTTAWSQDLTQLQRDAWDLYGDNVVVKNRLGEDINLTGFNQFIRSNSVILQAGGIRVDDGPTVFELPEADPAMTASASAATQLVSVVFDDTLAWVDEDAAWLVSYLGRPQNPQRTFFNGPWRFMVGLAGDSVAAPTTPDDQTAPFVITEGQREWIYARIARADGRVSNPFRFTFLNSA